MWPQGYVTTQKKTTTKKTNKTVTDYFPEALPSDGRRPGQGNDNSK